MKNTQQLADRREAPFPRYVPGKRGNYVLEHGLEDLTDENLAELLTFANAAASLITTKKGALRVMPERDEVLDFIASRK